ncbi:phenylacetaldoxime dehydratase family protein [Pseudonocardia endophytica]|uniref:Aldoxime dehydratase n=1 Tax=Pseudonocardia endophytica TaxID=401976 RepID=A0A4R1HRF4_PSEEN|nr:phenylacetaldoxime dehydratase family protein [Pseudonocardia endophytica]TCK25167.1 aldoxime dehydratase [Pseudonocardia endophytica]
MTESAIPEHLTVERTRPVRTPDGFTPPSPSFVARPPLDQRQVVMAYLGVQAEDPVAELPPEALAGDAAPRHVDRALVPSDDPGRAPGDAVVVAYWDDPEAFDHWLATHRRAWLDGPGGRWLEVIRPRVERYETITGRRSRPEGVAHLAQGYSDQVLEHAYWGSMRDRMPASQDEDLDDPGHLEVERDGDVVRVRPTGSVCLIRSGQDWSDTAGDERERYLTDIEPRLREGMDFLHEEGPDVGCWSNRYLTVLDDDGAPVERTFGLGWWRTMADLERWSESHPSHLAIFDSFVKLVAEQRGTTIRLYHEVSVAHPDECLFEYARCHDRTGLLRAL